MFRAICVQIGANGVIIVVDIITISVNITVIVDIRGIVCIVARRPQPPPLTLSPQAFFITKHPCP